MDGGLDSGRLGGICCGKFLPFRGFEPALKQRESECTSRGTNQMLPRTLRLPQCSLVFGPLSPCSSPVSLPGGDETSYSYLSPEMLDRAACRIRTRFGPGFSSMTVARLRRAPRRPSPARTWRESDKIGESAWRLRRVSLCWGSTLDTCRFLGCRQSVWVKMTPRLII